MELRQKRILVADDDPNVLALLAEILRDAGHDVVTASDGKACLHAMTSGNFDLLVLDIMMPAMDGFGVLRAVRRTELFSGRHLPTICITGAADAGFQGNCYRWGGDAFVQKPFKREDLIAKVDRLLGTLPKQVSDGEEPDPVFDYDRILRGFGGKEYVVKEILALFVSEAEERMAKLLAAVRARDLPEVGAQAHTLKSISGTAGASVLREAYGLLETQAEEGNFEKVESLLDRAEEELDRVLERVRRIL